MLTTKFILKSGKHFYVEVPEHTLEKFMEAREGSKYAFLVVSETKFEYTGEVEGMNVFKEADIIDIRAKQLLKKLWKKNTRLAQAFQEVWQKEKDEKVAIDDMIKDIGVSPSDPLVAQIKELKRGYYTEKAKAKVQALWWEAKRKAFRDQIEKANVNRSSIENEDSLTGKVLDELQTRITQAIKDYSAFPKEATSKRQVKVAALHPEQKQELVGEFDRQFGSTSAPGWGELKSWLESRDIQNRFPGEDYDSLRGYIYEYRIKNNYPISKQETDESVLIEREHLKNKFDREREDKDKQQEYWSSRQDELVKDLIQSIMERLGTDTVKLKQLLKAHPIGKVMEQIHYKKRDIVRDALSRYGENLPHVDQVKEAYSAAAGKVREYLSKLKQGK